MQRTLANQWLVRGGLFLLLSALAGAYLILPPGETSAGPPPTATPAGCDQPPWDWNTLNCFQTQNFWHHEAAASISGMAGGMLAFNTGCVGPDVTGCTFSTATIVFGRAVSPTLSVPSGGILTFKTARSTENNCESWDRTFVLHSTDGGATYAPLDLLAGTISVGGQVLVSGGEICGESLTAQTVTVPLPPGSTNIAFEFDSGDSIQNDFAGQFIDDVDVEVCSPEKVPTGTECGTPAPSPTPCPTNQVPVGGSCGTITPTPISTPTVTPCPTAKVPVSDGCGTPTPTPTPGGPEMLLKIKAGDCDAADRPTKCSVPVSSAFTLSVDAIAVPAEGYVLAQSWVDFGSHLTYEATDAAAGEITWPDCSKAVAFRGQLSKTSVFHGCITGLPAPLPISNYTGNLIELSLSCSSDESSTEVLLLPEGDPVALTSGALFKLPDDIPVVPKVSNLTINCEDVAPAAVGGVALGGELRGIVGQDGDATWLWAALGFGVIAAMGAFAIARWHAASG